MGTKGKKTKTKRKQKTVDLSLEHRKSSEQSSYPRSQSSSCMFEFVLLSRSAE